MRIKKTFQGSLPENTVVNTQSNSQINAYSCEYVNNMVKTNRDTNSSNTYSTTYINTSLSYSTSETKTGGLWINNKPIYRKVIQTSTPSNANTWVSVGSISNLRDLVNLYGFFMGDDGRKIPLNSPEPSYETCASFLNGNIEMKVNSLWTRKTAYIIVEYTKTTD